MALEPMTVSADEEVDPELDDMSRRFWICLVLTTPLLLSPWRRWFRACRCRTSSPASLSYGFNSPWRLRWSCGAACRSLNGAGPRLVSRNLNMFTLIALGTGTAFAFSAIAALFPGFFPTLSAIITASLPVYFEPAAVIVTLVLMGQVSN